MTELKCPVCNTVLDRAFLTDKVCGCPKCRNMGNIGLWELLIDTKKKLDRYENALTFIRNIKGAGLSYSEMCIDMREVAKKALNPEHSMVLLGRYSDEYLLSNLEQIKDNDKDVK